MSLVTNEAGESMGQLSFRVSHAVTVRKWLDAGRLKVFVTYRSGAGAGKSRAAGASLPPRGTVLRETCRHWGTFQMLPWTSRSTSSTAFYSSGQSERPPKLQEEGRGFRLLTGGGPERSCTVKALQDPPHWGPIELVLTQEKMLTGTHASPVGTHARLLSMHTWGAVCFPVTSVPKSAHASFPSNCH